MRFASLTVLYDQATEIPVEPVVIAMSSAFNPFPAKRRPPPRRLSNTARRGGQR